MKMRYNKTMGIIYIIAGVIFSLIYFVISLNGGKGAVFLTVGFVGILFGILFLTRTYFVFNDDSLILNAIIGSNKVTYKFQSAKEIEIDNQKIYLNQNGKRQQINISTWMIEKSDLQVFLQKIKNNS